jgi:voltage-gated sodium channel
VIETVKAKTAMAQTAPADMSNGMIQNGHGPPDALGVYQPVPDKPGEKPDLLKVAKIANEKEAEASCVEGTPFQIFGASLIMANALVIGMECDIDWEYWDYVETSFLGLFTFELGVKMVLLGPCTMFWYHADIHWNLFDFSIVSLGLFDSTMEFFTGKSGGGGFATLFRIIRLLRILRMFRIVKFLKQLYVLAFGLVEAAKAVFWVTILMVFVLYVCSIVLVKTVGQTDWSDPHHAFIQYRFGHILDTMLTLFILMSSPNLPTYEDEVGLLQSRPALTLFLCGFIIFGSFGIIALLTGVISQSMFEKNEVRKDMVHKEHEDMRQSLGVRCEELFLKNVELDGNGEAAVEQVKALAGDMHTMLDASGADITHSDVVKIIEFMDVNGTGFVSASEFKGVMEKIAEGMSPMSIQEIANRVGLCEAKIDTIQETLDVLTKQNAQIMQGLIRIQERRN